MTLRPMTAAEFVLWRAAFVREWAVDLAQVRELSDEAALAEAIRRTDSDLPAGVETPGHFLCVLMDGAQAVGTLWYSIDDGRAFIDDVSIDPACRRRGYAQQALALLEQEAVARGCSHVSLNVYRHNPAAISLYEKCGYVATQQLMQKRLA